MIDSGVDLSHEEFASRPNTFPLNTMTYTGQRGGAARHRHRLGRRRTRRTASAIVGIYPQAKLQLWDASPNAS